MIPILYEADERDFSHGGIGTLADTLSCFTTEERNGIFELVMEYPVGGLHYREIREQRIIKAKSDDEREPQCFVIYKISVPMNKKVTIYAEHITYQLSGNFVAGFRSTGTPASIMNTAFTQAIFSNRFRFTSDIGTVKTVEFTTPTSLSQLMGGVEGSILNKWNQGEYKRDNEQISFLTNRGMNRGVLIAYGKNLLDLKQETSIASTYTHVIPYAQYENDGNNEIIYANPKAVPSEYANRYAFQKAQVVDFKDQFENGEKPTPEKLYELAVAYIKANGVGKPSVNLTVKWLPLDQMEEYNGNAVLERVNLCDTVTILFEELGIKQEAKVIKIQYNTLKERIEEAVIGDAKSNFADTFYKAVEKIEDVPNNIASTINSAIKLATDRITGVKGGHVYIKQDGNGKPQEILIMDTDDMGTATKVWRWNVNGFGYSRNGINGPYGTAITMDGYIIGEYILANSITGNHILAGTIDASKLTADAIQVGFNELGNTLQLTPNYLNLFDQGVRVMGLGQNGMEFYQGTSRVGLIGSAYWQHDTSKKGVSMGLDQGNFVSFTIRNPSTGLYDLIFGLCNDTSIFPLQGIQMGKSLNLNGNAININSSGNIKLMPFSWGGGLMGYGNDDVYIGHSGDAYLTFDNKQIYGNADINMQGYTIKNVHIVEAQGTPSSRSLPLQTEAVFGISKLVQWIGEGELQDGECEVVFPIQLLDQLEEFHVSLTPLSKNQLYFAKQAHGFTVHGEQNGMFSYQVTAKKKASVYVPEKPKKLEEIQPEEITLEEKEVVEDRKEE